MITLDVKFVRGADCDIGHYLVVAKIRERLAINKQSVKNWMWRDLISGN